MARFANCPGEDCKSKVKITGDLPDGVEEINFCCVPCFQYTWAQIIDIPDVPHEHSDQCAWRQLSRIHEPVFEGEYRIHTPKVIPGGRSGPDMP